MIEKIKTASKNSYHAQRNWDRTKTIPQDHIDTFLEVIKNSPTKQAETHYKVLWTDDVDLIHKIYRKTKHFSVTPFGSLDYTEDNGKTELKYNVRNSQIYSNILFGFSFDWRQEEARTHIHAIAGIRDVKDNVIIEKDRQRCLSMGIAVGELILSANLLGYRSGLCSAFGSDEMKPYFSGEKIELLVGIGYPSDRPRTEHEDTYNRDIVAVDRRTGSDNSKWHFPSFKKKMEIRKL